MLVFNRRQEVMNTNKVDKMSKRRLLEALVAEISGMTLGVKKSKKSLKQTDKPSR